MRYVYILVFLVFLFNCQNTQKTPLFKDRMILESGTGGYHTYRIPAVVKTDQGTVLLFSEGRKESASDFGTVHLLVCRSTDKGQTWSAPQIVWEDEASGKDVTIGNPCPVFDETTQTCFVLFTRDNQTVFVTSSRDEGLNWEPPREITSDVRPAHWTRYWTGPGHGLQIKQGIYAGRLIFPSFHLEQETDSTLTMRSHMIYSDDHGKSWQIGKNTTISDEIDKDEVYFTASWVPQGGFFWMGCECMAVETPDHRLYLTVRNQVYYKMQKAYAWSDDGGETWTPLRLEPDLPGLKCQSGIIQAGKDNGKKNQYLFTGIAGQPGSEREHPRFNLKVYLSQDQCQTWPISKTIHPGRSAYSDMVVLDNGEILCFYEGGENAYHKAIRMARFNMSWVLDS